MEPMGPMGIPNIDSSRVGTQPDYYVSAYIMHKILVNELQIVEVFKI